ncbi:hypothetical protein HYV80_07180 [Candidatus Woesearchaeota archaeon]|nr:hypothetical protein [Candidatus Woesearchaeota archaeon]
MQFINERLKQEDIIQIAETVSHRVNSRAAFRLGRTSIDPGMPRSIAEAAADELYERSGLGALELPMGRVLDYISSNERRLAAELNMQQFRYAPSVVIL